MEWGVKTTGDGRADAGSSRSKENTLQRVKNGLNFFRTCENFASGRWRPHTRWRFRSDWQQGQVQALQ
jgi:hypothetical protein